MTALNLPLLMVASFLFFTLAVGLHFSRKTTTLREYAIGHKKFATATLVATVLATAYGGGGLTRGVQQVHKLGLYWVIFSILTTTLSLWIIIPLASRMSPFMRNLSMAETMGSAYGKVPRVVTALSCIASSIASLAIQINVISLAISMCIDAVDPRIMAIIATLILIAYSTFGGIRAVTYTDVLQFVTFTIVIPILAWFMFKKMGKPVAEIIPFLQTQKKFEIESVFSWNINLVSIIALILSSLVSYIKPSMMQRVYMSSSTIQAKSVFLYSGILSFVVKIFILLVGMAVFVGAPDLPMKDIWGYVMGNIPPFFRGFVSISLLSMAMSTADSFLNACSVMISHDIVESMRGKAAASSSKFWLTRLTAVIVGLCAMILAFYRTNLLDLLKLSFNFSIPVITAPFILAIFGFRGTASTALIGMATGTCGIMLWNKWIQPKTGIDGDFVCMLANGAAMMAAHYLLPQPKDKGWVGEDDELKQRRQAKERKKARSKENITHFFTKDRCANLTPDKFKLTFTGAYILLTAFLSLLTINNTWFNCWSILQILLASSFIGIGFMRTVDTLSWKMGLYWVIGLFFCLSLNTVFHWWNVVDYSFTLTLSLSYLVVALLLLPLHLGVGIVAATTLIILYPIYRVGMPWTSVLSAPTLLLQIMLALLICSAIIYHKAQLHVSNKKVRYLELQRKKHEEQELKEIAYTLNITQKPVQGVVEEDGAILENVVGNVTQAISFIDNTKPLYKQDFQSIINKFSDWAAFLKRRSKSKDHLLLMPTEITITGLISRLEVAVEDELEKIPRIFVENEKWLKTAIVCDVDKVVDLLLAAVLKVINKDTVDTNMVTIHLYSTSLAYHKCDDVKDSHPKWQPFSAIAIVMSNYNTPREGLPKVASCYNDENPMQIRAHSNQESLDPIGLSGISMHRIIRAHYGHLELPKPGKDGILMVLPRDVNAIRDEMISKLPIDLLSSESPITPKEQANSLVALMEFHEYVCKVSRVEVPVVSEILLLLRRCYGFKRHASGQLFYVRATGITKLVAKWIDHSPKPIYASLLYDLVRHTRLSLSYVKANYDFGIFCFVQNVLSVDKLQDMEQSMLFVSNRFKEAVAQDKLSVLYIKLAERLYDLRNAEGYANKEMVKYMAKETLSVDIVLAKKYLDAEPKIANALEMAAKNALEICKESKCN